MGNGLGCWNTIPILLLTSTGSTKGLYKSLPSNRIFTDRDDYTGENAGTCFEKIPGKDIIENIFVNNKGDHDLEILLAGPENHNIKAVSKLKINIEENILKKLDELSFDYFLN